jgi:hypothetical protein
MVGRDEIAVRLTTAETGDRLLALDVTMPAGGGPPGLHRHAAAEVYRVLDGEPMERFLRSATSGEDVMTLAARHGIESVP